ncbi:MAG: Fe-S cluster assembly protein SufD [Alphaproteobacteria bacterium]|nr:Fe-S cluster assembly protein SufD [Alphaproteobacteria bacterium]MBM3652239.1 Fe-S cluster assembly protein SufD [Alphaproteobacteria bacterium]
MIKLAEAEATLSSFYEEMRDKGAPRLRAAAWAAFSEFGLPSRRVESWHYTDFKAAMSRPAPLATASHAALSLPRAHDSLRLVTLDGVFRPDLSDIARLPEGVAVQSLRDALTQGEPHVMSALASADIGAQDPILALNAALMQDGVVIEIASGTRIGRAIELATLSSAEAAQSTYTRALVMLGEGAQATMVETLGARSAASAQDNSALVLRLAQNARVDLVTHLSGGVEHSIRVASLLAHLDAGATISSFALIEDDGLLRRQIFARLDGERASAAFNGATLGRGRLHADTTLIVDHAKPNGASRERFRHILDDQSVGVFQGKVIVRQGAQKTDGAMQSKALLLSEQATMNNKPELEIFADDVQCGHGATCGRLDKDQLFYLSARGLPRREAEALLIEGFANEAMEALEDDQLKAFLADRVSAWLSRRIAR